MDLTMQNALMDGTNILWRNDKTQFPFTFKRVLYGDIAPSCVLGNNYHTFTNRTHDLNNYITDLVICNLLTIKVH